MRDDPLRPGSVTRDAAGKISTLVSVFPLSIPLMWVRINLKDRGIRWPFPSFLHKDEKKEDKNRAKAALKVARIYTTLSYIPIPGLYWIASAT